MLADAPGPARMGRLSVVRPRVIPYHHVGWVRALNAAVLGPRLRREAAARNFVRPVVLASNPVAAHYLDTIPHEGFVYLRLDDYPSLPGVDPVIARTAEAETARRADLMVVTAPELAFSTVPHREVHLLEQGVDRAHFAGVPVKPPRSGIIGFYGLLAEWIDWQLVAETARRMPDRRFAFVGPVRWVPDFIRSRPNIELQPAVPYTALPDVMARWDAAWIPFEVTGRTIGVSPLKLREYIAAGLPTVSTPLPAVRAAGLDTTIVTEAGDAATVLYGLTENDDAARRTARKAGIACHDWTARAAELRARVGERMPAAATPRRLSAVSDARFLRSAA